MRLPSHLLATLSLACSTVGIAASCEPAYKPEPKAVEVSPSTITTTPLDEVVRMSHHRPAVAPRYAPLQQVQPQPVQLQPQPIVRKKPPPRKVWTSVCGHAPQLHDPNALMKLCGKG